MNRDFEIPQCLREVWTSSVGIDPMIATIKEEYRFERYGVRIILFLALGIILVLLLTAKQDVLNSFGGIAIFLAIVIVLMSALISEGVTRRERESAKGFAEALETFSKHSSIELHRMSDASYKDLISDAERILFQFARTIMEYQEKGEITQAKSFEHGTFAPVHKALSQLGLVENAWDRFFQKEPSPGISDSMGPCD